MANLLTPTQARLMSGKASMPWIHLTALGGKLVFGLQPSLKLELDGVDLIPDYPCIVATNHTHNYDFLPLRYLFFQRKNIQLSTWIKARAWQGKALIHYLSKTANVPIASRGYVISGDFMKLIGRKPTDQEYRVLRDHLDQGAPLPDGEVFERLQQSPRDIFDTPFSPTQHSYRDAVEACFMEFMDASLEVAQRVLDAGGFQHVNPQGTRSSRLTMGKPGVMHIAAALQVPILPVTILGMRSALPNQGLKSSGGTIVVKCGTPYRPDLSCLSTTYRPFAVPDGQDQAVIDRALIELMERLNELCDEEHGMRDDYISDGKTGVARFL